MKRTAKENQHRPGKCLVAKLFRLHMHISNALLYSCRSTVREKKRAVFARNLMSSLRFLFPNLLFVQERPINAYPSAVHIIMTKSKWSSLLYPLARLFICSTLCSPAPRLVANTDEVVGELLDGVGCDAGLDGLRVVGDEDGLGGLDDDDALSALE